MPTLRPLDPAADRTAVDAFFRSIADYVRLERDEEPGPQVTEEYFSDAPPGCDPARSHRIGLFHDGRLMALAEMAQGYPGPQDAYLGFLAVSQAGRGQGLGLHLLRHMEDLARKGGHTTLYLAVLDANPRARAFWELEGFTLAAANRPVTLGRKTQVAHRLSKPL